MDNIESNSHSEQIPQGDNPERDSNNSSQQTLQFTHHHAFIIGIDNYEKVPSLVTAVNDARKIAEVLSDKHHFQIYPPVIDPKRSTLHTLLHETMPGLVGSDDRVLFYFAGHGIASDGDDGPAGYLAPADADPADLNTFIPMTELREALNSLSCRHLLIILDCCFSGAFKWSSGTRHIGSLMPKKIYKERFDRFIHDPAWQVITSAAYDQKAMDLIVQDRPTGDRGLVSTESGENHSPFALALFQALAGEADTRTSQESDGLITASELYSYIRDRVEPATIELGQQKRQTPGFFPLSKHDKGEFIFLHPRHRLNLSPRPSRSPYKGWQSFDESDASLFYGRSEVISDLKSRFSEVRMIVITGPSGTGKSSLVKAGLLPWLREEGHSILPLLIPGSRPLDALEKSLKDLGKIDSKGDILIIDQLEEVITQCKDVVEINEFLTRLRKLVDDTEPNYKVIVTVRNDFESDFSEGPLKDIWQAALFKVPPFSLEQLMEAAVMPTVQEVLIFDPRELVDRIVGELVQAPGALPLLSITLDALYQAYNSGGRVDRAMTLSDYEKLGGVMGIMHQKADSLYQSLSLPRQAMMRKIFLRLVTVEGDLEGRKVPLTVLHFSTQENLIKNEVIDQLVDARLITIDANYIEPSHPSFVRSWKTLLDWIQSTGRDTLLLGERLASQADQYTLTGNSELLWNKNPNLANAARLIKLPNHLFNEQEEKFVRKSIARNVRKSRIVWSITISTMIALAALAFWAWRERKTAEKERATAERERNTAQIQRNIAEKEKERAILSLFEGLKLNMKEGYPGSLCAYGLCEDAPEGEIKEKWQSLGMLPISTSSYLVERGTNIALENENPIRDFVAARQFGKGHVLAYAQDRLTMDKEISDDSDNLTFVLNALAWLTSRDGVKENCGKETTILVWEGTFIKLRDMTDVQYYVESRGWKIKLTNANTLEQDLRCASVLWYLSDWAPPSNFASTLVPIIVQFVKNGGGLLMGGLGWSYAGQYKGTDTIYSGAILGKPFGISFTLDYFTPDRTVPIKLLQPE